MNYLDILRRIARALESIDASMADRTIRMSGQFSNFNDLNDYLINKL